MSSTDVEATTSSAPVQELMWSAPAPGTTAYPVEEDRTGSSVVVATTPCAVAQALMSSLRRGQDTVFGGSGTDVGTGCEAKSGIP